MSDEKEWRPFEPCLENTRTAELRSSIEPREGHVFSSPNYTGAEMKVHAEWSYGCACGAWRTKDCICGGQPDPRR